MKRYLSLALAVIMILTLAACGSTAPAPTDEELMGTISGNSYVNPFLGIGCELDQTWSIYTMEQIAEVNGIAADTMDDEALADTLRENGTIQPFFASNLENGSTVNLVMEDLGMLYGKVMDAEAYAQQSAEQLPAAMESMGMTDVTTEVTTVTLAGQERVAVALHGLYMDMDFYEVLVCMKQGDYIAVLTVGSYITDYTADVLTLFNAQ